jgi:hypothetical protein
MHVANGANVADAANVGNPANVANAVLRQAAVRSRRDAAVVLWPALFAADSLFNAAEPQPRAKRQFLSGKSNVRLPPPR